MMGCSRTYLEERSYSHLLFCEYDDCDYDYYVLTPSLEFIYFLFVGTRLIIIIHKCRFKKHRVREIPNMMIIYTAATVGLQQAFISCFFFKERLMNF